MRARSLFIAAAVLVTAAAFSKRVRTAIDRAVDGVPAWIRDLRTAPAAPSPDAPPPPASYHDPLPGMECLVNEHGIRLKAIAKRPGVQAFSTPGDASAAASPLEFFRPYFIFERGAASLRIGTTPKRDSELGWVRTDDVELWPTRVGARYRRQPGVRTPPLLVFQTKADLMRHLYADGGSVDPLARTSSHAPHSSSPWPIIELGRETIAGTVYELVRLAFLGQYRCAVAETGPDAYSPEQVAAFREGVSSLDIVFCVDNTQSTGPFIHSMRCAIEAMARGLHELPSRPAVRFGLVLYRDHVANLLFNGEDVVQVHALDSDLDRFLRLVRPLQAARVSSEEAEEAGYEGLEASLEKLAWRTDALAQRAIILVGDAAFHEPGSAKNRRRIGEEEIVRGALERRVTVFTIQVGPESDSSAQYRARSQPEVGPRARQFSALASRTGGESCMIEDSERLVEGIGRILGAQATTVAERTEVLNDLALGQSPEAIAADRLGMARVTEILEFLQRAGVEPSRFGGVPGPAFATGWAACEVAGVQIVDREVYIARPEIDLLLSSLHLLCSGAGSDFAQRAYGLGVAGRVHPLAAFLQEDVPGSFDIFLASRGIAVGRTSLLRLTAAEIRHMPEERRAALRERLSRTVIPGLLKARNDDSLWAMRGDVEFGWIAEDLLP